MNANASNGPVSGPVARRRANNAVTARAGGHRVPPASTIVVTPSDASTCYRSLARSALKDTATVSTTFIEPISIEYGLMPNSD